MLTIRVSTNAGRVASAMSNVNEAALQAAADAVFQGGVDLQAHMMRRYLSVPGTWRNNPVPAGMAGLHVGLTNRLRSSILIASLARGADKRTTVLVGTNVEYAAYHEFGFEGRQHVGEHARRVAGKNVMGKETGISKSGKSYSKRVMVSEGLGMVRAYDRYVIYKGHPFAAPALEDKRQSIIDRIRASQIAAWKQAVRGAMTNG